MKEKNDLGILREKEGGEEEGRERERDDEEIAIVEIVEIREVE